jgi:TM2 domain-containing membrane protein YozV
MQVQLLNKIRRFSNNPTVRQVRAWAGRNRVLAGIIAVAVGLFAMWIVFPMAAALIGFVVGTLQWLIPLGVLVGAVLLLFRPVARLVNNHLAWAKQDRARADAEAAARAAGQQPTNGTNATP